MSHEYGYGVRYADRAVARSRAYFLSLRGRVDLWKRAAQIAALPTVDWKGRRLYSLTCDADFGKGPHVVNVPEHVLWLLIDLRAYRCPYH